MEQTTEEALDQANGEKAKDTWSDREIEKISDDRFGFEAYANILADRIPKVDTPLTIGIYGQWGSGKSSLMRMTQDLLKCEDEDSPPSGIRGVWDRVKSGRKEMAGEPSNREEIESPRECIWINVWQLSSQDEVWQAFLQALFSDVQNKLRWWQRIDKRKLLWQIGGSLLRFALIAAPLIIGLTIGSEATALDDLAADAIAAGGTVATLGLFLLTAARIGPILDAFRQTWKVDLQAALEGGSYEARISELTKLQGQFAAMVKLLVGEEGKLIVFIDDLDRCTPDKVPEVLEAIKLFTTTPGCVYIIGLDHDIVRQGIEAKYKFPTPEAATEYLEKIVQVPFHLLPLDQGRVERFIADYYDELPRQSFAAEVFSRGLEPNPRKIKRALNIYRMLLDLKDIRFETWEMDEVDEELVAKMVVIQSRFRRLHGHLVRHPDFLLQVEERATNDGLSGLTLKEDDDVGKLLLGQPESEDSEAKEGLVEAAGLDALNRLLKSGQKKFNDADQVLKIDSYIYLIATVEGGAEGLQPNREDRDILLSGDRPRIREHLDLILKRGGTDEKVREQIRAELVKRLEFCVKDSRNSFSQEQRASAGAALVRLALMLLFVTDPIVIRKHLDEILRAAPDENARERRRLDHIGWLQETQGDAGLYTLQEQELARLSLRKLALLPLISGDREIIRDHLQLPSETGPGEAQRDISYSYLDWLESIPGNDDLYTPEEQGSALIAQGRLEILPLLDGDKRMIRKQLEAMMAVAAGAAGREEIRLDTIRRLKEAQEDGELYTSEEQASASIAQVRLEMLPFVSGDPANIRKGIDDIMAAGADETEWQRINDEYVDRLVEVKEDAALYTSAEQESAGLAQNRLKILPLISGERTMIQEQLELILATDPDAAEQQDTDESLLGPLRAAQEDSGLYTPGEQALARSAQVVILYRQLFGELPAFDDSGEDPLGLDLVVTIGKLLDVLDGLGPYADSEVTLAHDILELIQGDLLAKMISGDPAQQSAALTQLEQQEADLQGSLHRWKERSKAIMIDESQTVPTRAGAGDALALLGDDRPGVGTVDRIGIHLPDIVWGEEVPAGKYKIGGDSQAYNAFRAREVEIMKPYRLARYLVTYAQFQCFLEAPDFADPRWWKEIPQEEQEEGEQAWPLANRPRERVSWYQAMAFCCWLSDKLGEEIDLPHEYEWEVAARYPDGRFYPWGNDFEATKANTRESGLEQTTAVGIYPDGANPTLKLYDLSGNVWEWCRNKYEDPDSPDTMEVDDSNRTLRGGSWVSDSGGARAAYRFDSHPASRGHLNLGFRVVVRRPSHGD